MNRIVMKFGGSSVETVDHMKRVATRIIEQKKSFDDVVVVLSAMGKTTNQLLRLAQESVKYPSKREVDLLISTGEQVSISLLSMILNDMGYDAIALTGYQAGIKTSGLHTKNRILDIDTTKIEKELSSQRIVVVAGFQGSNEAGDITTLGRGGSDTTAVALAAKLHALCEIYTDVEGVYGVDPRIYKHASKLDVISYEEMKEMAILGAKVMEPRSIEIGHRYGVIIHVRSSLSHAMGTLIKENIHMETRSVTGCTVSEKVMMVTLNHYPNQSNEIANLFIRLAENEVNVDMISQTQSTDGTISLAFTASADDLIAVDEVLDVVLSNHPMVEAHKDLNVAKVSVVGSGMRHQTGVAAELFKLFASNHIQFKLVTTSEISISYTMDKAYMERAVSLISENFSL